jgi:hypothetical protein
VLFLYGLVAASHTGALSLAGGGVAGLALACLFSFLLYRGLVAIPLHRLFTVTNWLIALLAAGMAGQAAAVLHSADLLPGWGEQLWDTSAFLSDNTIVGKALHALIGYSARPSGVQVAAWLGTLGILIAFTLSGRRRTPVRPLAAATLLVGLFAAGPSRAQEVPVLEFRQHRFVPARIEVPANVKFRLMVKNNDDTADEFESRELNREKLVPPGQTITVFLGPLAPGEYKFFGDFHQDTAQGVMVAK